MSRIVLSNLDRFSNAAKRPYVQQAIVFLNAYWNEFEDKTDDIYEYLQGFKKLDFADAGCDLDEFYSHKFLETCGETLTALELRNALREIDVNQDHRMSLLEYLIFKYHKTVDELIADSPKGSIDDLDYVPNPEQQQQLLKAKEALAAVQAEIAKIEKQRAELEAKSKLGGVRGNMAKQELFALLNNDPTELNAALITAEAAVRRCLPTKKAKEGVMYGEIWYMNKEIEELKKYRPKGGLKYMDA
jgi:hypothetical protein